MSEYYDSIASGYDELYGEEQSKKWEVARPLIKIHKESTVLDFGCGTGLITKEVAKIAKKVIGVDTSVKMIDHAPKLSNVSYMLIIDGHPLPFENGYFDRAVSFTVLQDIGDWDWALSELKRVVSGEIVLTILKREQSKEEIEQKLEEYFDIIQFIEEEKDFIFLLESS